MNNQIINIFKKDKIYLLNNYFKKYNIIMTIINHVIKKSIFNNNKIYLNNNKVISDFIGEIFCDNINKETFLEINLNSNNTIIKKYILLFNNSRNNI